MPTTDLQQEPGEHDATDAAVRDPVLPLDVPEPLPLVLPSRRQRGREPVRATWKAHKLRTPRDCDHCCQVAYEALTTGTGSYPGIRQARQERHVGTGRQRSTLRLCREHAVLQRQFDDAVVVADDLAGEAAA